MGKINVYDKIMIENQKKRENMEIIDIFYIYFQLIDGLAVAAKPGGGQRGHLLSLIHISEPTRPY